MSKVQRQQYDVDERTDTERRRGDDKNPEMLHVQSCFLIGRSWVTEIEGIRYTVHDNKGSMPLVIDSIKPLFGVSPAGHVRGLFRGSDVYLTPVATSLDGTESGGDLSRLVAFRICGGLSNSSPSFFGLKANGRITSIYDEGIDVERRGKPPKFDLGEVLRNITRGFDIPSFRLMLDERIKAVDPQQLWYSTFIVSRISLFSGFNHILK